MTRSTRCDAIGLVWLGLVAMSLVALLLLSRSRRRGLAFWVPVVAVLGPAGLLARLSAARGRRPRALVETVGDLTPVIVGMVVALQAAVLVPGIGQSAGLQLLVLYCIPLTIGLFFYQAPLLAWSTGSGYARTVVRRLPDVLISTNLALAGLVAICLPLINWQVGYCGLGGFFSALQWWAIAVLGALVGGLPLYAYRAWGVRRGFGAWSALLWGNDGGDEPAAVSSPPWRRLWLWVVLSYGVLVAGIAAGAWGIAILAGVT